MAEKGKKIKIKSTIDGYYIHDVRKAASFAFDDFVIYVKLNEKNRCYDIFLRDKITDRNSIRHLDKVMLDRFIKFYPKSLNVVVLSEQQVNFLK